MPSTQASVPFLHVADFKGIRRGWDLRDTQVVDCHFRGALLMGSMWFSC